MAKTVKITAYLLNKTAVLYFLALVLFFVVLTLVFFQPVQVLEFTSRQSGIAPLLQLTLSTLAGLLALVGSRMLMMQVGKGKDLLPANIAIWLFAELIVCVAMMCFVAWMVSGFGHVRLASLAGDFTLGIIFVEIMPYVVSYLLFLLHEERSEVERLKKLLPQQTDNREASMESNVSFFDKGGRLMFATLRQNVLYVEAANNYTNIHYMNGDHEEMFILHNSLKELEEQLSTSGIARCHRCFLVNVDNVKLMRKDGTGFLLELLGTTRTIPVTKTYASSFATRMGVE